jgi:hypothetical protein
MIDSYNERLPQASKLEWKTTRAASAFGGARGDNEK